METTLHQTINTTYTAETTSLSMWGRFMNYCQGQENNRLLWLGVILMVHGCILTPITVFVTLAAGPSFSLFMAAIVAMAIALVTNLAAMPTRITIPAFAISIVIDIAILVSCVFLALS